MGIDQLRERGTNDLFLIAVATICLSVFAIGFVVIAWAVGGQAYFNSFYGVRVLAFLAVCLVIGAALYAKTRGV